MNPTNSINKNLKYLDSTKGRERAERVYLGSFLLYLICPYSIYYGHA